MYVETITVTLTTDAGGDASERTPRIRGRVVGVRYVPTSGSEPATGADLTISGVTTGISVLAMVDIGTSALTRVPHQPAHALDGTALTYDATQPVTAPVYVAEELDVVMAQGGSAKAATVHLVVEGGAS